MSGVAAIVLRGGDYRLNSPPSPAPPGGPPFPGLLAPEAEEEPIHDEGHFQEG